MSPPKIGLEILLKSLFLTAANPQLHNIELIPDPLFLGLIYTPLNILASISKIISPGKKLTSVVSMCSPVFEIFITSCFSSLPSSPVRPII